MINIGLGTFKKSKEEIGTLYSQTRTSFLDSVYANFMNSWNLNPFSSTLRAYDMTKAYQSSNTYLNRDDLNKKYSRLGLIFKEDTREGVVDYIVERKHIENKRASILARGPQGKIAMVEPIVYGVAKAEQADYNAYDAFANIAIGGLIGSAAHVGFGRIGDFLAQKRGKPNIYQKLAAISPENQRQLLDYSVGRVLKGEPVNTGNVIVEKTSIGDAQLNKLDDQIAEFNTLYKNSLENGDRTSAKIYLKNVRNLQKTQRDLVEAKRIENDRIKIQEQSNMTNRNAKPLTEAEKVIAEKNLTELELEAENIQQRTAFHQKQLGIKDEDLTLTGILEERTVIEEIDSSIKNKTKIRNAIEAGTNCTKRNS